MPRKRSRKPAPPRARTPRTVWQRRRDDLLAAAGYTKRDVWQQVRASGGDYVPSTVRAVLDGRWRNTEIEAAFCRLTSSSAVVAFPLDEPPYGREPVNKPRSTRAKRAAQMLARRVATSARVHPGSASHVDGNEPSQTTTPSLPEGGDGVAVPVHPERSTPPVDPHDLTLRRIPARCQPRRRRRPPRASR